VHYPGFFDPDFGRSIPKGAAIARGSADSAREGGPAR
jgi:hypothetical protein